MRPFQLLPLALAALAACAPVADPAAVVEGEAAAAPGPGAAVAVAEGEDACGAAGFQSLVGTSVGALDADALPEGRRIIFPGQGVTMDFRAERLNVEIGSDDRVARVYCG
jgi:hypothetical protein